MIFYYVWAVWRSVHCDLFKALVFSVKNWSNKIHLSCQDGSTGHCTDYLRVYRRLYRQDDVRTKILLRINTIILSLELPTIILFLELPYQSSRTKTRCGNVPESMRLSMSIFNQYN